MFGHRHNRSSVKEDAVIGYVGVLNGDGSTSHIREVEEYEKDAYQLALQFYEAPNHKKRPLALIPKVRASLRTMYGGKTKFSKGSCEFQAITEYVRNIFGIALSSEDSEWFQEHPLVEAAGTPMSDTLRVAQELITPYHLRISRVRALPGVSLPGQLAQWPQVLGINPFGMMDSSTGNRAFAAYAQISLAEADALFRFEFSEEPLQPCVVCGVTALDGKGYPGGHASYTAPRGRHPGVLHVLQFQMEREDRVVWQQEPVFPKAEAQAEEKEDEGSVDAESVSIYMSQAPTGEQFNELTGWGKTFGKGTQKDDKASKAVVTTRAIALPSKKGECFVCERQDQILAAPHICTGCWARTWDRYRCTGCSVRFENRSPISQGIRKDDESFKIIGACPQCGRVFGLSVSLSDALTSIVKNAYFGKRPSVDDRAIVRMLLRQDS